MRKRTKTLCQTFAVLLGITGCQTDSLVSYSGVSSGKLPPCKGPPINQSRSQLIWTNCNGSYQLSNGDNYVGSFLNGLEDGQGKFTHSPPHPLAGEKQVGEFREGKLHGQGTVTFSPPHRSAGEKQVGEFREGKLHGQGTVTSGPPHRSAGVKRVGEFREDKLHGQGTVTFSSPHPKEGLKYVGEFREGKIQGQGTVTFSAPHRKAGLKYVGEVREGKLHGQGTLTFSAPHRKAGEEMAGIWENDVLMTGTRTFITPHERAGEKEIWKNGSSIKTIYPSKTEHIPAKSEPKKFQETPLEKHEEKCAKLGFTRGTEKFGDCVMRLMDL